MQAKILLSIVIFSRHVLRQRLCLSLPMTLLIGLQNLNLTAPALVASIKQSFIFFPFCHYVFGEVQSLCLRFTQIVSLIL
ncbi:hypothetical protein DL96DRAFT_1149751 [Flagelloscypha sp. PMI_526]|nr:hypothetical protein DL96DRAFT_1149751 [Flagelloscypha sp. PMI_526]